MVNAKLVQHKLVAKKKKPNFVRQEYHKRNRLGATWRKPKGVHSKIRLRRRGKPKMVSIGYKMPEEVRGLTKAGLGVVPVSSVEELKALPKDAVPLMRKVSKKQRMILLTEAQKLSITFVNFKNIPEIISTIKKQLAVKREAREIKETKKKKKAEEEKKKAKMSEKQAKTEDKVVETLKESGEVRGGTARDEKQAKTEDKVVETPEPTDEQKAKIDKAAKSTEKEVATVAEKITETIEPETKSKPKRAAKPEKKKAE